MPGVARVCRSAESVFLSTPTRTALALACGFSGLQGYGHPDCHSTRARQDLALRPSLSSTFKWAARWRALPSSTSLICLLDDCSYTRLPGRRLGRRAPMPSAVPSLAGACAASAVGAVSGTVVISSSGAPAAWAPSSAVGATSVSVAQCFAKIAQKGPNGGVLLMKE